MEHAVGNELPELVARQVLIEVAGFASALLAQHRVNDGLTVTSFLLVGLDTKRELLFGESALLRQASLPVRPGSAVWSFTR